MYFRRSDACVCVRRTNVEQNYNDLDIQQLVHLNPDPIYVKFMAVIKSSSRLQKERPKMSAL